MEATEEKIKQTAKKIFFGKGHFNAKMHEIAKEAGVNRALLHYYFRSRENLFESVLREAMEESFISMFRILSTDEPFENKIEQAIGQIVDCLTEYPFIENFIISEINKDPGKALTDETISTGRKFTKKFLKEIEVYLKKNKLKGIEPEHFIVNMMALCAYPSSTKPIIKNILNYSENEYMNFLRSRKKMITKMVLMK
jgi:TetR/AcrR family transcriptional regulator